MKRAKSENDDVEKEVREPYLSGAYIRSFVKQLSSSSSSSSRNCSSMREKANVERETAAAVAEGNPQKKQVRRRLQTRKPYQEKLLNMAEARREIVTALKLHRASMKQQQQYQEIMKPAPDFQKSRRNPRIYAGVNFPENDVVHWSVPPPPPPPVFMESLDFALPSQALGLNLNLHDFVTVPSSSIYSSSSPSTSSSPPPPPHGILGGGDGERFEFLNCGEVGGGEEEREVEIVRSSFDEVMEFPPWLNADGSCLQHVDSPDFFQASVLPCMEIEEIEGMDGDWLA